MNEPQPEKLTRDEAKVLYEANLLTGKFRNYYKYSFYYDAGNEDVSVILSFGGDHDNIYRFKVDDKPFAFPPTLIEAEEQYNYIQVEDKKTGKKYD